MSKLTIKNRYATIPNHVLNDPKLSFKAKGLFGYLQSKPDEWKFSATRITSQTKDGLDAVRAGLKELENAGFLKRTATKNSKGQYDGYDYILLENPSSENPSSGSPSSENSVTLSNKDSSNKDHSNKEKDTPYNPPEGEKSASSKESKNKKFNSSDFKPDWMSLEDWRDCLETRKKAGAKDTKRSLKIYRDRLNEGHEAGYSSKQIADAIAFHSWRGFNVQWLINEEQREVKSQRSKAKSQKLISHPTASGPRDPYPANEDLPTPEEIARRRKIGLKFIKQMKQRFDMPEVDTEGDLSEDAIQQRLLAKEKALEALNAEIGGKYARR